MKKTMMFAIIAMTSIILMASFDIQLMPHAPVSVPANVQGDVLYVCPVTGSAWDGVSRAMHTLSRPITIVYFFVVIILAFVWMWALYQNLLKDEFKREAFTKPWQFTKLTFWVGIIILMLTNTPNYYKRVHINGARVANPDGYMLCENNVPGPKKTTASVAVRAHAVQPRQ